MPSLASMGCGDFATVACPCGEEEPAEHTIAVGLQGVGGTCDRAERAHVVRRGEVSVG
jgi:hypothetical protein